MLQTKVNIFTLLHPIEIDQLELLVIDHRNATNGKTAIKNENNVIVKTWTHVYYYKRKMRRMRRLIEYEKNIFYQLLVSPNYNRG